MKTSNIYKTSIALLWMIIFPTAVFASVIIMNNYIAKPKIEKKEKKVTFDVEKKKPKKKKNKIIKQHIRPRAVKAAPVAPPPMIASSISTAELGIPQQNFIQTGRVSKSILGDVGSVVMTQDSVDTPPRPGTRVPPEYPDRARAKGVTGYVLFNLLINADGNVKMIKILESHPPGVFEESARSAVKEWKFTPALYKGEAVKVWAKQKVSFKLK